MNGAAVIEKFYTRTEYIWESQRVLVYLKGYIGSEGRNGG
jgi:hypothetical protein